MNASCLALVTGFVKTRKPQRKVFLELSAGVFCTHGVAGKALCRSDLTLNKPEPKAHFQ